MSPHHLHATYVHMTQKSTPFLCVHKHFFKAKSVCLSTIMIYRQTTMVGVS